MRILGIDTSGMSCSVAIIDEKTVLTEINFDNSMSHSKHLMKMIDMALKLSDIKIRDLQGIAVNKGPGTFTGLRIGISCIKGLSSVSNLPVAGISGLKALAVQSACVSGLVCPMIDARRKEVYTALYRYKNGVLHKEKNEAVLSAEEAVSEITEPCMFTGSGTFLYKEIISDKCMGRVCFGSIENSVIKGAVIARIGMERIKNGVMDDINKIAPFYIRKSDAEINFPD